MTRINTNVGSLVAQNRLQSSNEDLNSALTRLSTGLRINSGADDPAGLIASEALRSEVTSLGRAISNTNRASQIISTADSALAEVSNLLNDVRGLVVEAANNGALSGEEIAANQLQIDSSLEAINRISQSTTFQGRRLLDGSLDFESNASSVASVTDVSIDQANLGATGSIDVDVVINSAAETASIDAGAGAFSAAAQATTTVPTGINTATLTGTGGDITIQGQFDSVVVVEDDVAAGSTTGAAVDLTDGVLTVSVGSGTVGSAAVLTALNAEEGIFAADDGGPATDIDPQASQTATALEGAGIAVTANEAGSEFNNVQVNFVAGTGADTTADFDAEQGSVTVTVGTGAGEANLDAITAAIDGLDDFSAEIVDGSGTPLAAGTLAEFEEFSVDAEALPETTSTGTTGGEVLNADLVFQLNGSSGAETFNFGAGSSIDQIAAAVNLVSDATGVEADTTNGLSFNSTDFGSEASVAVEVISEGAGGTFESSISATRATGSDIDATVNGIQASSSGNELSINTSTLDLSLTVEEGSSTNFSFSITGGGAQFQLGPDVVSTQQASIGIGSVSTGQLGGPSGRLFELGSGQARSLTNDVSGAAEIVDEVIGSVNSLRGRLGAFQATTLDSNLVSLNETRANLSEAQSSIRDADFAEESARLTRAQILVQSGTNVLSLANQSPQNVLQLLG